MSSLRPAQTTEVTSPGELSHCFLSELKTNILTSSLPGAYINADSGNCEACLNTVAATCDASGSDVTWCVNITHCRITYSNIVGTLLSIARASKSSGACVLWYAHRHPSARCAFSNLATNEWAPPAPLEAI